MIKNDTFIISDEKTRGNGKDIPIRMVTEIRTTTGDIVAESDPYTFTIEQIGELFDFNETVAIGWGGVKAKLLRQR